MKKNTTPTCLDRFYQTGLQLLMTLGLFLIVSAQLTGQLACPNDVGAACDDCPNNVTAANPDLTADCEVSLTIAIVIDESNSIGSANAQDDVELGVMAFLNELACTPAQAAIIEFGSISRYVVPEYTPILDLVDGMQDYFDGTGTATAPFNNQIYTIPPDGDPFLGGTNWQAALTNVDNLPVPDLVLFFTDGNPTTYSPNPNDPSGLNNYDFCGSGSTTQDAELYNAVQLANKVKGEGSHMFVLGVGAVAAANIQVISDVPGSGGTEFDPNGTGDAANVATSDYSLEPDFAQLQENLATIANDLCPLILTCEPTPTCTGESNGMIDISIVSDAVPPYRVIVNGTPAFNTNQTTFVVPNLSAGSYEIAVETGVDCFRDGICTTVIIEDAPVCTIESTTAESCDELGNVTFSINSGFPNYTYEITNDADNSVLATGAYTVGDADPFVDNISGGNYTVTVTDDLGCESICTFSIAPPVDCCPCTGDPSIDGAAEAMLGCNPDDIDGNGQPDVLDEILGGVTATPGSGVGCMLDAAGITFVDGAVTATGCMRSVVRTYSVNNECGDGTTTFMQTITWTVDLEDPMFAACPATPIDLGCNPAEPTTADAEAAAGTPADDCGITDVTTTAGTITSTGCMRTQTFTVTATDGCAKTAACEVTYEWTVDDEDPEVFAEFDPISCNDEFPSPDLITVTDNCGLASRSVALLPFTENICDGYTVGYEVTAIDNCGNTTIETVSFDILPDTEAPEITPLFGDVMNNDIIIVECQNRDEDWTPFGMGANDILATDDCSDVTVTFEDTLLEEGECGISDFISRWSCVWTATDECGNANTFTVFMTIIDTEAPTPDSNFPLVVSATCDNIPDPVYPTATDNCSSVNTSLITTREEGDCAGSYVLVNRFTFTDGCGNSSELIQTVNVMDEAAPEMFLSGEFVFDLPDGATKQVSCQELWDIETDLVNTIVVDDCDPEASFQVAWEYGNFVDCSTFGYSYLAILTVTASDDCGNATTHSITFEVQDNTAPELVGVPEDVCADEMPEPVRVLATDLCGSPRVIMTESAPLSCGTDGVMVIRTWTASDRCGNESSATQRIILSPSTTSSMAILDEDGNVVNSGDNFSIEANCAAGDYGIREYVLANIDESSVCALTNIIVTVENVQLGDCTEGEDFATADVNITATSVCSGELSFAATVSLLDRTGPVFGEIAEIILPCGEEMPQPQVEDLCGTSVDLSGRWIDDPTVVCAGENSAYRYEWTATDECGNVSSTIQVVSIRDYWGPEFFNLPDDSCQEEIEPGSVTAIDRCTGAETEVVFVSATSQLAGCGRLTTYTWTATDACGNVSTAKRYRQTDDVIAPVLFKRSNRLKGAQDGGEITIDCPFPRFDEQGFPDFGPRAFLIKDNCPGGTELGVSVVRLTGDACDPAGYLGSYQYVWTATDACGNASTFSLVVTLVDETPPAFFDVPEPIVTIFCDDEVPAVVAPNIFEECSTARLDFSSERVLTADGFQETRTWLATDLCGNADVFEQVITYADKEINCKFELAGNSLICGTSNNELTVTNSGGRAPYTYAWRMVDCDGFITGADDEQTVLFTSGFTSQNFEVTVTDADGCQQVCTFTVACKKETFTTDPIDDTGFDPDDSENPDNFTVFPNPATDNISVILPAAGSAATGFSVIDLMGKRVLSGKTPQQTDEPFTINIRELPAGPYLLQLNRVDGTRSVKQIVVIK